MSNFAFELFWIGVFLIIMLAIGIGFGLYRKIDFNNWFESLSR